MISLTKRSHRPEINETNTYIPGTYLGNRFVKISGPDQRKSTDKKPGTRNSQLVSSCNSWRKCIIFVHQK